MYEEIRAQPDSVRRSLESVAQSESGAARLIAAARRVFVTGCGTSFHAARAGAWFLQSFSRGKVDARAVEAFDLVTYLPGLRPDDVVIAVTHSGSTTMTVQAIERARRGGAESIVVTGFPESEAGRRAGNILVTGWNEEHSWAHTASYTAALSVLLALANDLAVPEERLDLRPLPEVVAVALELEEMMHRLAASAIVAERVREPSGIVIVGAGINDGTALEGVLKLLETCYVQASAFALEELLHGPLAAVTEDTLVIVLAPDGPSNKRLQGAVKAVEALGATPVVLAGEANAALFDGGHRLLLPDLPEVLSPIPYIVPLQLFSYFLAVGKGLNPDLIHRDDERHRTARTQYE